MRFSLSTTALVTAVALTMAGCGNDAAPVVIETPTPTATATEPSASPTPTVASPSPTSPSPTPTSDQLSAQELWEILPEGADIPDIRGATITARYFLELRSQVLGGDGEARRVWEALSSPECMFCASVLERSDEYMNAGERFVGGELRLSDRPSEAFLTDGGIHTAYVGEIFTTSPHQIVNERGEVVRQGGGDKVTLAMHLTLTENVWVVDGVNAIVEDL